MKKCRKCEGGLDLKRYDYENMLGLVQADIKNYQHRLTQMQISVENEDDVVIKKQANKVIEEMKSLETFIKCSLGEF